MVWLRAPDRCGRQAPGRSMAATSTYDEAAAERRFAAPEDLLASSL